MPSSRDRPAPNANAPRDLQLYGVLAPLNGSLQLYSEYSIRGSRIICMHVEYQSDSRYTLQCTGDNTPLVALVFKARANTGVSPYFKTIRVPNAKRLRMVRFLEKPTPPSYARALLALLVLLETCAAVP